MAESKLNIYACLRLYSAVRSILLCLSATDASAFVCATGIKVPQKLWSKVTSPVNDIPEHAEWIDEMMRRGHKVLLVGSDVERLMDRIRYPGTRGELATRTLCIWLAVIPEREICYNRGVGMEDNDFPSDEYYVFRDGTLRKLEHDAYMNMHRDNRPYTSMFIPRADSMRQLPSGGGGSDWYLSTIPNENNIKVVYFATTHTVMYGLNACLAPISRATRGRSSGRDGARECYEQIMGEKVVGKSTYNVPILPRQPAPSQWKSGVTLPWMRLNDGVTGAAGSDEETSSLRTYEPCKYFNLHADTAAALAFADPNLHTFFIPYR